MDFYLTSLLLGVVGLGVMAASGLGHQGAHGGGSHGHGGGHGHGGPAHGGHHFGHSHSATGSHGTAQGGGHHGGGHHGPGAAGRALWAIASPRFLFSFFLGLGTTGLLARPFLGGPLLLAAAIAGGVLFERAIVSPLWNLSMRFASTPASMLESAVSDEATAVTAFDANGQGIVAIEVDGQVVQILATLRRDDRTLPGQRIRAGQKVRVEDIDSAKNCCTVSLI